MEENNGKKWWESLFSVFPGILGGTADIVGNATGRGTPDTIVYNNPNNNQNAGLYIGIGAAVLVVILVLVLTLGSKK